VVEGGQAAPSGGETFPWRQAHWSFIILGLIRQLRGLIFPFAVLVFSRGFDGSQQDLIWYGVAIVFALFSGVVSVTNWWFHRFRITDREIMSRSGIIAKQERVVPFERIQTVDLDEAPLERIFRIVRVRIETAAGGQSGTDIAIPALKRDDATALRQHLLTARQRARAGTMEVSRSDSVVQPSDPAGMAPAEPVQQAGTAGELLRRITSRELLIAGATSGRFGPAAAIVGALSQFGDDLIPRSAWNRVPWENFAEAASNIQILISVVTLLGIIAWLLAIATTALTFGNFEIRREDDQLSLQYGLLDRRRTTIPIRRIQAIQVREGVLRQRFGYVEIRFETAGFGNHASSSGVLFPLLPKREVPDFLAQASPEFVMDIEHPDVEHLPARARARYIIETSIGWVITIVFAAFIVWRFLDISLWWVLGPALLTPVFAWLGSWRYRDAGWLLDDGRFLLRWRSIGRTTMLTRVQRIQYRKLTANPLQRRAGLVSFEMSVAAGGLGGQAGLAHMDRDDAERLVLRLRRSANRRRSPSTWLTSPRVAADS
jgi:putative membrane protein